MSAKRLCFRLAPWVLVCLALFVLVAAFWPSGQPSYDGQPLSYWFRRLPLVTGEPNVGYKVSYASGPPPGLADSRAALAAVQAMGTNSLPFLIRKLQGRPPPRPVRLIQRYAGGWPVIRTLWPPPDGLKEREQAVAGLLVLCPVPDEAERKLRAMSLDFNSNYWYAAQYVLKAQKDPRVIRDALSAYKQ